MKIEIDCYKNNIWKRNALTKQEMKKILSVCLIKTNNFKILNVFINISFVNIEQMIEYNIKYRNKNNNTNVLSFENEETKELLKNNDQIAFLYLGEMVLCFEKIEQEAKEYNKIFKDRLYHLFIHSILHLLGYNHIEVKERIKMEKLEINILKQFNIYNPYIY